MILAAGLKGIENEYPLMPAVTEDLAAMAEVLGEQVFDHFLRNKRADWDQYQAQVTPYELKYNLGIL